MWKDRLGEIIELLHQNKTAEDIYVALDKNDKRTNAKVGHQTESRFEHRMYAYFGFMVLNVNKSTNTEDKEGVDYYVTLTSGERFPVQVKSSDTGVTNFKQDPRYTERFKKKIIVINSAHYISKSEFKKHFIKELVRIRGLDLSSKTRLTREEI